MKIFNVNSNQTKIKSEDYAFCEDCNILIQHDGRKNSDMCEYYNYQQDKGYTYLYGDKRFIGEPYIYCPQCANKIQIKEHDIGKLLIIEKALNEPHYCIIL